jgi:hypothetical protein
LRKVILEILAKAELKPWPRLFHNLRGSLQTDLADKPLELPADPAKTKAIANAKGYPTVTNTPGRIRICDLSFRNLLFQISQVAEKPCFSCDLHDITHVAQVAIASNEKGFWGILG